MIQSIHFTKAALIMSEAKKQIESLIGVSIILSFEIETSSTLSPRNILNIVSQVSGIEVTDFVSKSRNTHKTYCRYVCYYLLRNHLNMTYHSIANVFDQDHSTVIAGLSIIKNEPNNKDLKDLLVQSEVLMLSLLRDENTI